MKCKMSPKQLEGPNEVSRVSVSITASAVSGIRAEEMVWN